MKLFEYIIIVCVTVVMLCNAVVCVQGYHIRPNIESLYPHPSAFIQPLLMTNEVDGSHRYLHSISYTDPLSSKSMNVSYDVKLGMNTTIHSLDHNLDVVGVECTVSDAMTLILSSSAPAASLHAEISQSLINGKQPFITGNPAWNCVYHKKGDYAINPSSRAGVLLRQVTAIADTPICDASTQECKILVHTNVAAYSDMFENARVQIVSSMLPSSGVNQFIVDTSTSDRNMLWLEKQGELYTHVARTVSEASRRTESMTPLGGWWSALTGCVRAVWHGAQYLANKVKDIADGIVETVKVLVTGDYHYHKINTLAHTDWNYDASTQRALHSINLANGTWKGVAYHLDCTNCWFNIDVSSHIDLDIDSWTVTTASSYIQGTAAYNLQLNGEAEKDFFIQTAPLLAGTLHIPQICFSIGTVPICIDTSIPIHLQASLNLDLKMTLDYHASATATMRAGFIYTHKDGLNFINEHDYVASGTPLSKAIELDVSLAVSGSVLPTVIVDVDHIGRVTIGLNVTAEALLEFKSQNSPCSKNQGSGLKLGLSVAAQGSIGGGLHIEMASKVLVDKQLGPYTFLSGKWPITSVCIHGWWERSSGDSIFLGHARPTFEHYTATFVPALQSDSSLLMTGANFIGQVPSITKCGAMAGIWVTLQYFEATDVTTEHFIGSSALRFDSIINISNATVTANRHCKTQTHYAYSQNNLIEVDDADIVLSPDCDPESPDWMSAVSLSGSALFSEDRLSLILNSKNKINECIGGPFTLTRQLCQKGAADACSGHGVCTDGVHCECSTGYAGPSCSYPSQCSSASDCSNHGVCSQGLCDCDEGYAGHTCEKWGCTDDYSCSYHGTCVNGSCHCSDGYAGDKCEKRV